MVLRFALTVVAVFACPAILRAAAVGQFATDARPLLQKYCLNCHGGEKVKGDVTLSAVADEQGVLTDPKLWRNVVLQLNDRTMPPANKPQPTAEERERLVRLLHDILEQGELATMAKDPGRVTIRRLNRAEYNYTVRDLLGVHTRPADAFPADGAGGGGFDNNADTLFVPPILMEQYLKAADAVLRDADRRMVIVRRPDNDGEKRQAARECIETLAKRAFRRPVTPQEVDRYVTLFNIADKRGEKFDQAVRFALRGVLVSPQFLFRIEQDKPQKTPWKIGDLELASRLSYFIWASMPDDELLKLATESKLSDPAILEAQVKRMVEDPRSRALAEEFGGQWLKFKDLNTTANPDRMKFPGYTAALRDAMYNEGVEFVDSVFREDVSLLKLIDADYVFVNDALARHYGLPKVDGPGLKKVTLPPGSPRGGVMTMASTLTITSFPLRTSPVLRGKWVLEEILGAPPPPPPPDVPELPKDDSAVGGLSFREQLEKHRKNPECASCHARMDPIGFGMENFDPIGRFRTELSGKPVDASGELTNGEKFSGPADLKAAMLKQKDAFARNLAEKLLSYALGRGLEYYDQPTVKRIVEELRKNDYRSGVLVLEIAKSYPFQYRRNEPVEVKKQ